MQKKKTLRSGVVRTATATTQLRGTPPKALFAAGRIKGSVKLAGIS